MPASTEITVFQAPDSDPEVRRRLFEKLVLGFIVLFSVALAVRHGADPLDVLPASLAVVVILTALATFLIGRRSPGSRWPRFTFVSVLLFGVILFAAATGGIRQPAVVYLPLIPLAGGFLLGRRAGWSMMVLAMVGLCWLSWLTGVRGLEPGLSPAVENGLRALHLVLETSALAWFAAVYEKERERSEEALRSALEGLRGMGRSQQAFLADVSHELRNPVAGILGLAEIVAAEEVSPPVQRHTNLIRSSCENLLRLLDDLLELSRLREGRFAIQEKDFELGVFLEGILDLVRPRADANGTKLELALDEDLPLWIRSDPTRLREVLLNFLTNAVKHTPGGHVRLAATLVEGSRQGSQGRLKMGFEVRDDGAGMSREAREKLFGRYAKGSVGEGTGLGLMISRQLVDALQGDLTLESEIGEGTMIRAVLPVKMASAASVPTMKEIEVSVPGVGKSLLVADDDPVIQLILEASFRKLGFEVDLVGDGSSALARMETREYDGIFLDARMPVQDGPAVARELRERGVEIPIVFVTANATPEEREECLVYADDLVVKPFTQQRLAEVASRHFAESAQRPPFAIGGPRGETTRD